MLGAMNAHNAALTIPQLHSIDATLTPRAPFDLDWSLRFLSSFPPTQGEQALAPRALCKALRIGGRTLVAEVRAASGSTVDAPRLAVRLFAEAPIAPATRDRALARLRHFLSLDDDLAPFYAAAAGDGPFAPIAARLRGLHQVTFPTPFEIAAWAILTQRNRIPIARGLKAKLTARLGGALEVDGRVYAAFPEAHEIAAAGEAEVAAAIGAGVRAERIAVLARAFAAADDSWLRGAPVAEVEAWLRALPGIGPWSAAFILLRGLGRTDHLPVELARLDDVVAQVYGRRVTAAELRRLAERYGAQRGYWAYYLRFAGGGPEME